MAKNPSPPVRLPRALMTARPYVLLSCTMSVDDYIGDATPHRLLLSNEADFDRADQVRAESDAILIGATTLLRDNPRLIATPPSDTRQAPWAADLPTEDHHHGQRSP